MKNSFNISYTGDRNNISFNIGSSEFTAIITRDQASELGRQLVYVSSGKPEDWGSRIVINAAGFLLRQQTLELEGSVITINLIGTKLHAAMLPSEANKLGLKLEEIARKA